MELEPFKGIAQVLDKKIMDLTLQDLSLLELFSFCCVRRLAHLWKLLSCFVCQTDIKVLSIRHN